MRWDFWCVDQAKVAYEIPLSARDREDDNLFKDFEDQLSDDSSGNHITVHLWLRHYAVCVCTNFYQHEASS